MPKIAKELLADALEKKVEALRKKEYEVTTEEKEVKAKVGVDPEVPVSGDSIDRLYSEIADLRKLIEAELEAEKEQAEKAIPKDTESDPRESLMYSPDIAGLDEFMKDVRQKSIYHNIRPKLGALEAYQKTTGYLEEGATSMGGALVPEELIPQLLKIPHPAAVMRPLAWVISTNTKTFSIPRIVETTRASSTHGNIVGYWTAEGGSITESNPVFGQVNLSAKKLAMYTHVTNELLSDNAYGLGQVLQRCFSEAMAYFEDKAFIKGTGVNEPLGLTNAGCKANQNTTASHFYVEDAALMMAELMPGSFNNSVWLMSQSVITDLLTMDNLGGGENLWMKGLTIHDTPPNWRLFGRPIYFTEFCATLGTSTDVMLIDPTYYIILDRQGVEFEASPHPEFQNDRTVYRLKLRTDGQPWLNSQLTLANTQTVSPVVNSHHA